MNGLGHDWLATSALPDGMRGQVVHQFSFEGEDCVLVPQEIVDAAALYQEGLYGLSQREFLARMFHLDDA